jgi:hypothetical protein
MNKKCQSNKRQIIFPRKKERRSIRNQDKGDRTAEKHRETERWQRKVGNSLEHQSQLPWAGEAEDTKMM